MVLPLVSYTIYSVRQSVCPVCVQSVSLLLHTASVCLHAGTLSRRTGTGTHRPWRERRLYVTDTRNRNPLVGCAIDFSRTSAQTDIVGKGEMSCGQVPW